MSADWNETKSLLLEVEQLFNRDDDVRDIYDIKKMADEIRMHQANNLKSAKEIIKEMTTEVSAREAAVMAPSSTVHSANLEKFVKEKENVNNQIDEMREVVDKKRENISKLATQALQLKQKSAEYDSTDDLTDSRTAYALSLYGKISNITWDYSGCVPGTLSGCVGNDRTKEFNDFSIDTRSKTSYEVADSLWNAIADGVKI